MTGLVNPPYPYLTPFHLFPLDSIGVRSSQKRPSLPLIPLVPAASRSDPNALLYCLLGEAPFESTEIVMQDWSCSWKA